MQPNHFSLQEAVATESPYAPLGTLSAAAPQPVFKLKIQSEVSRSLF